MKQSTEKSKSTNQETGDSPKMRPRLNRVARSVAWFLHFALCGSRDGASVPLFQSDSFRKSLCDRAIVVRRATAYNWTLTPRGERAWRAQPLHIDRRQRIKRPYANSGRKIQIRIRRKLKKVHTMPVISRTVLIVCRRVKEVV